MRTTEFICLPVDASLKKSVPDERWSLCPGYVSGDPTNSLAMVTRPVNGCVSFNAREADNRGDGAIREPSSNLSGVSSRLDFFVPFLTRVPNAKPFLVFSSVVLQVEGEKRSRK